MKSNKLEFSKEQQKALEEKLSYIKQGLFSHAVFSDTQERLNDVKKWIENETTNEA